MNQKKKESARSEMDFFSRNLTLWVALCIIIGVAIGQFLPVVPDTLGLFTVYEISIPIAILIWLMIYPMMLKIDFKSIVAATKKPKGLIVTCTVNWLIKPFTMYLIAAFFLPVCVSKLFFDGTCQSVFSGSSPSRRGPLYRHGLRLESPDEGRSCLHPCTGCCE